jgi:chromosome partitioning protein
MAKGNSKRAAGAKRPRIIALTSTKGGSGKSTVAACLAGELHNRGISVALLDVDPQRTLTAWHGRDGPLRAIIAGTANGAAVTAALKSLSLQADVVLVDTPGFSNRDTLAVLAMADIALIPFAPTPADALGAAQTVQLLREVNQTVERASTPVRIALLMTSAGRGGLVAHIRTQVAATGADVLQAVLGRRVAYQEALLDGTAPCWMGRSAAAAAAEISALADELGLTK